jgi:hypothetical protein
MGPPSLLVQRLRPQPRNLLDLELRSNGPNMSLPERRLGSDQLSLVPGCAFGQGQCEVLIVVHGHLLDY